VDCSECAEAVSTVWSRWSYGSGYSIPQKVISKELSGSGVAFFETLYDGDSPARRSHSSADTVMTISVDGADANNPAAMLPAARTPNSRRLTGIAFPQFFVAHNKSALKTST
jgi:hypothetical protein